MLLGPAERVTSRWVVDLSGAVWVRAKSLQGRRTATSAHRHERAPALRVSERSTATALAAVPEVLRLHLTTCVVVEVEGSAGMLAR